VPAHCYLSIIEIHLHFPEGGSLKGKRKELSSLKAQLKQRFGATVSETDHHELWQRSTLTAALVGRELGPLERACDDIERFVLSRFPETVRFRRGVTTAEDVLGE
jgi:uncharacterized protein YlxP (DUF503 family)